MNTPKFNTMLATVTAVTFFFSSSLNAQPMTASSPDRAEAAEIFEARLEDVVLRLDLNDEQRARSEPVIRDSFQRRQALIEEACADGSLSLRDKRNLRDSMRVEGDSMIRELDGMLTPTQLAELRAIQEEHRAQVRAQMEQSR